MDGQVAEITEENDVGVGSLAVHADATDSVLVHGGGIGLRPIPRARNLRGQYNSQIERIFP